MMLELFKLSSLLEKKERENEKCSFCISLILSLIIGTLVKHENVRLQKLHKLNVTFIRQKYLHF